MARPRKNSKKTSGSDNKEPEVLIAQDDTTIEEVASDNEVDVKDVLDKSTDNELTESEPVTEPVMEAVLATEVQPKEVDDLVIANRTCSVRYGKPFYFEKDKLYRLRMNVAEYFVGKHTVRPATHKEVGELQHSAITQH